MSATNPVSAADPSLAQANAKAGPQFFVAALLSALLPGLGQLLVRRWRNGLLMMLAYAALFTVCFWLRLPQTFFGVVVSMLALIGLCVLAASDAAYGGQRPETKPTQWWLAALLPAAMLVGTVDGRLALRVAGFRTFTALGTSMAPALPEGSHLVVDGRYYRHKHPKRGDIIVFDSPTRPGLLLFKRVIATGGDSIRVEGDTIYLNGRPLSEPYARLEGPLIAQPWVAPATLPADKLFVAGDNRNVSFDSRYQGFGLVDSTSVHGKVIYALPAWGSDIKKFE
jgi:signal peptidase I